ncbi:hypothetical protein HOY82DRAFT_570907 [Tuber indicum]|nr:hypothetical protein HOY82DRAFT_570907 [Tuber indicum]
MDGWMDGGARINGMGLGGCFVSCFISLFLCLCSLSIQVLECVGFVFYCMSLLGDWTVTFHCNLMDMMVCTVLRTAWYVLCRNFKVWGSEAR